VARQPEATVIVPCLDSAPTLRVVLHALRAQSVAERLRLVVVDNGSFDESRVIAHELADVVLFERRRGIAHARNRGLANCETEYVLGIDADCRPADDRWAERHLDALVAAPPDVVATAGPLVAEPSPDPWSTRTDRTPHPRFDPTGEPSYAVGGNHAARVEPLREVGGYPVFSADDAALGRSVRAQGWRYVWVPDATVYHRNPAGPLDYYRQMRKVGRYAAEIDGPPPRGYLAWSARQAAQATVLSARAIARGDTRGAIAQLLRRAGQASGATRTWRRR
jgi:glycosyltransferase involved in cell wall biosynthesis